MRVYIASPRSPLLIARTRCAACLQEVVGMTVEDARAMPDADAERLIYFLIPEHAACYDSPKEKDAAYFGTFDTSRDLSEWCREMNTKGITVPVLYQVAKGYHFNIDEPGFYRYIHNILCGVSARPATPAPSRPRCDAVRHCAWLYDIAISSRVAIATGASSIDNESDIGSLKDSEESDCDNRSKSCPPIVYRL